MRPPRVESTDRDRPAPTQARLGSVESSLKPHKGRPTFWGLGNFVWPSRSAESATTAVARIVVAPDGEVEGKLLAAYIEDHGHPVLR